MSTAAPTAIPSQAELQARIGQAFTLQDAEGHSAALTLLSVRDGIGLDSDYVSYSAVFGLPPGITAPQGSYQISPANEAPAHGGWLLFVTPVRPDRQGVARLEAVFHTLRQQADDMAQQSAVA